MELSEWKKGLLERATQQPGDLKVDPSMDIRPDSIDELLENPDCNMIDRRKVAHKE